MKTAICIVTKDNYFATRYCIENLLSKLNRANAELFVFDNNSQDQRLIKYINEVATVKHFDRYQEPKNFTECYNTLFRSAINRGCDYICVFPCDILVNDNWLNDLTFYADNIMDSGVCGIRKGRESVHLSPLLNHDHLINVWIEKSNFISGVAIFERELLKEIGGFNEDMSEGFEQDEFCFRVSAIGRRNFYIPNQSSIKTGFSKRTEEGATAFKSALQQMFESKEYKKDL